MEKVMIALVAGLIGGAGGVWLVELVKAPDPEVEAGTLGTQAEDIARLERKVDRLLDQPGPMLQGAGASGSSTRSPDTVGELSPEQLRALLTSAIDERLEEKFDADLKAEMKAALSEAVAEGGAASLPERIRPPRRKAVTLSEAAAELQLSAREEDELRQIYADSVDKAVKLLAGDDMDPAEVKRELMEARDDPGKQATLIPKYLPRVLPKIGEFMAIETQRSQAVRDAIGPEKAGRLNSEFNVQEQNPFGFGGMGIETRIGGR